MRRRILANRTRGTATSAGADISLAIDVEDDRAAPAITHPLRCPIECRLRVPDFVAKVG